MSTETSTNVSSSFSSNCNNEEGNQDGNNGGEESRKKFDNLMNVTLSNFRHNLTQTQGEKSLVSSPQVVVGAAVAEPLPPSNFVPCKSLRSVNEICQIVCSQFDSNLDKQSRLTKIEKDRAKQRFKEIYTKAFRENVLVDGEPCPAGADGDLTSDFEAVDLEKKKSISEILIPALDDATLKTVTQRKNVPKICRKHWKSYGRREIRYLNSLQIQNVPTTNKDKMEAIAVATEHLDSVHSRVSTTVKAIGVVSKDVVQNCGKLENLLIVKDMQPKIKNSQTYREIYEDEPPGMPTPSKCMTPLKRSRLE